MTTFRKLNVWQRARDLANALYRATDSFPEAERFGLTSQLRRAAVSIMCNIAEGSARHGRRDQLRLLNVAYSSGTEVESLLTIAHDQGLLDDTEAAALTQAVIEVRRMLAGLMRRWRECERR
jgi:four helix bundle protein